MHVGDSIKTIKALCICVLLQFALSRSELSIYFYSEKDCKSSSTLPPAIPILSHDPLPHAQIYTTLGKLEMGSMIARMLIFMGKTGGRNLYQEIGDWHPHGYAFSCLTQCLFEMMNA